MTLSDSELRAMRRTLATYPKDVIENLIHDKRIAMAMAEDKIDDMLDEDHPEVIRYRRALCVHNCAHEELERRRTGAPIESLPGMTEISTSTHTMNGR
jgi:hypothetical protein